MPKTYADVLAELAQRNVEAINVVQATQLAALRTARDVTTTLAAVSVPLLGPGETVRKLNEAATGFTFAVLDRQVAYIKSLADVFAPPRPAGEPAVLTAGPEAIVSSMPPAGVQAKEGTTSPQAPSGSEIAAPVADVFSIEPGETDVVAHALPPPPAAAVSLALPATSNNRMRPSKRARKG